MRKIFYYILSIISSLFLAVGFFGMKLTSAVVAILAYFLLKKYIGEWGWLIAVPGGLFAGGLFFMIFERLNPYFERIEAYGRQFNKYPYIERYGPDYPQPTPADFGITQEEFNDYNKRFQFEYIKLIMTYSPCLGGNIYLISHKMEMAISITLFVSSIIISITMHYLLTYINEKLSEKHQYYHKIKKYQNAFFIYRKIEDEKKSIKS